MTAGVGRNLKIKEGGVEIAGARNSNITIGASSIDITSNDDNGFRTLLGEAGEMSIDLSIDGISKDASLRDRILAGPTGLMITDLTIEYENGDVISGNFFLNNVTNTATYNDAVTFSATLQSSGEWVFAPVVV